MKPKLTAEEKNEKFRQEVFTSHFAVKLKELESEFLVLFANDSNRELMAEKLTSIQGMAIGLGCHIMICRDSIKGY